MSVRRRTAIFFILTIILIASNSIILAAEGSKLSPEQVNFFTYIVTVSNICMAVASSAAIFGQSRAIVAAIKSIARQPQASRDIQTNLIIGLALIESLAIYVLLIALIIFFLKPFVDVVSGG